MVANKSLHIEILSPEGITYKDEADEVIIPTEDGEIAVLHGHVSLFTKLKEGIVIIKKGGKETDFAIVGGFLQVENDIVTILSDYAVKADSIQIAQAEAAKKRAEEILKGKIENEDFAMAEKELAKSILTLKVADKVKRKYNR